MDALHPAFPQPSRTAGLRLHHIGHAVANLQQAAAHFQSQFGYRELTAAIHDPLQTALVQFLQLPDETHYLELVAPDGPNSRLARVAERGGGLHHLCYTTPSVPAAIEALSAAGMRLISDPKPAVAFAGRPICWLLGSDRSLVELVERRAEEDRCEPGTAG